MGDGYETMLVGGLPEEGESDSLFILDKYGVEPVLIDEMVREPSLKNDRAAYARLKSIIREFKPDIVHTHASKAGALGRKAAHSCGVPIIVHTFHGHVFHSYFGKAKTMIFKTIEKSLAKKSTGIIAISNVQKQELANEHSICKSDKISVIPLGFDLAPFHEKAISQRENTRNKYEIDDGTIAIGIVGRLAPIKDHGFFLRVIRRVLLETTEKLKIFIVGDGPERESIEEKVALINIDFPGAINMTSWIKDIGTFNAGMDILCLTSKNEGTPVSLIEAQAANIPVITTDVGGVRDIMVDGETGFIIPRGDEDMYASRLLELCQDKKKRIKMSQKGWAFVEDKFQYKTLIQNMDSYYKELLDKKS